MRGYACEPHTDDEGALQLSTLQWSRGKVLTGRPTAYNLQLDVLDNAGNTVSPTILPLNCAPEPMCLEMTCEMKILSSQENVPYIVLIKCCLYQSL